MWVIYLKLVSVLVYLMLCCLVMVLSIVEEMIVVVYVFCMFFCSRVSASRMLILLFCSVCQSLLGIGMVMVYWLVFGLLVRMMLVSRSRVSASERLRVFGFFGLGNVMVGNLGFVVVCFCILNSGVKLVVVKILVIILVLMLCIVVCMMRRLCGLLLISLMMVEM